MTTRTFTVLMGRPRGRTESGFPISNEEAVPITDLAPPGAARAICIYRNGSDFLFAEPDTRLKLDDEVVVLTRAGTLKALRTRFG